MAREPRNNNYGQLPATHAVSVTPHDTNAISETQGLMVNVAGNVAMRFADSDSDVTIALTVGQIFPFAVTHVRSTSTTATGITALYQVRP